MLRLLSVAFAVMFASPAFAQQCPSMADFMAHLAEDYGETPFAGATVGQAKAPMIIFLNQQSGTWTIVIGQGGCAKPVAGGEGWIMAPAAEPVVPGEDT